MDSQQAILVSRLRTLTRRLGFDIIRHPSSRLLDGHLVQLLRELSIDHVLDVGANVGQYAQFLRSLGYSGTIISFEPVAESFDRLRRAADPDPGIGADLDAVRQEVVRVVRLDSIFDDYVPAGARVFAKLAVQGWDMEVLRGAEGCLNRLLAIQSIVSVIPLYEGMPSWLDSVANTRELGFEVSGMFPTVFNGPFRVVEFDAFVTRRHGAPAE